VLDLRASPTAAVLAAHSKLRGEIARTDQAAAFLPFPYDEKAARQRELDDPHLGEDVPRYTNS
jgi:hypothetical protein